MNIRAEQDSDAEAVDRLVSAAFGDGEETADFVRGIRRGADVCLALVAAQGADIVGQAQFGAVPIETASGPRRGAYLACLSVAPHLQRRGIGSKLVRTGLEQLRSAGVDIAMVLGSPLYYPRFGFSSALGAKVRAPYSRVGEAFMAIALVEGALDDGAVAAFPPAMVSLRDDPPDAAR